MRFLSTRVDNFLVSGQQDRKSAEKNAGRQAGRQASGRASADRVVSDYCGRRGASGEKTKRSPFSFSAKYGPRVFATLDLVAPDYIQLCLLEEKYLRSTRSIIFISFLTLDRHVRAYRMFKDRFSEIHGWRGLPERLRALLLGTNNSGTSLTR